GNVLGAGERRVPELTAPRLGRAFPPSADSAGIDHDVAFVTLALDPQVSERDQLCLHQHIVALGWIVTKGKPATVP
ncbi:MAG TPA: hypothetical protein VFP66_08425, partial [Candidatus Limnocylindrales bacterium]|nr:hypothetical protein [Candidatus Limnocylindrales bacterium]